MYSCEEQSLRILALTIVDLSKNLFHREQQRKLVDAELELAAAKRQGYKPINCTSVNGHRKIVVGIFTNFGGQSRRTSSRKNWLPSGTYCPRYLYFMIPPF